MFRSRHPARLSWLLAMFLTCSWQITPELAPGWVRQDLLGIADDLTSLACGVTLARSDFAMDVSKPSRPFGREGFGMS